jgi:hypothetical protein
MQECPPVGQDTAQPQDEDGLSKLSLVKSWHNVGENQPPQGNPTNHPRHLTFRRSPRDDHPQVAARYGMTGLVAAALGQPAGMGQGVALQNVTQGWSQKSFGHQGTPPLGMEGLVNNGQEVRIAPTGMPPAATATDMQGPMASTSPGGGGRMGQQGLAAVATTMPSGYSGIRSYLEKLGLATNNPRTVLRVLQWQQEGKQEGEMPSRPRSGAYLCSRHF